MKTITKKIDFPKDSHYAVMEFKTTSVYHEGDQRSRDYPGHGYPAYTEEISNILYHAFDSKEELENWLKFRHADTSKYVVISASPLSVETKVVIKLEK